MEEDGKLFERALKIAVTAHAGQVDKGGAPYILHPLRVMAAVSTTDEKVVAVLHDVVEDTNWTFEDLAAEGIPPRIIEPLRALTKWKEPEEARIDAAKRAAVDPIARNVKLADVTDNMDLSRIPHPTAEDHRRLAEYREVKAFLLASGAMIPGVAGSSGVEKSSRPVVYVDMDNVLVDFPSGIARLSTDVVREYDGRLDEVPGIFSRMDPMPGAVEGYRELSELFDTFILSTAPWKNPSAWSDKLLWVQKHLGDVAHKRLILSHHKNLNDGEFLIDDRTKNGADRFPGVHIHFGQDRFPDWTTVMVYMRGIAAAGETKGMIGER